MNFLLSTFGLHNPYITIELPEHAVFPISNEFQNGIDLDYTSLLLGKKYFIDIEAYKYICDGNIAFLSPMAKTLQFLKKEDLLEVLDVSNLVKSKESILKEKVEILSKNTQLWYPIVKEQWKTVKNEYRDFHKSYGTDSKRELNINHFPIINYLHKIGESDNYDKLNHLTQLLENKRKSIQNSKDNLAFQEISKPLLAQILINELVITHYDALILDWDDNEPYYKQIYTSLWNNSSLNHTVEHKLLQNVHKLFDCIIPDLKPSRIEDVVKFIRDDKAINSLRNELWNLLENGETVSDEWYKSFINRLMKTDFKMTKRMKRFRWFGSILGLIPGTSFVTDVAVEIALDLVEKFENGNKDIFHWYYVLQKQLSNVR